MDRLLLREEYSPEERPTLAGRTLTIRLATIGRVYTTGRAGRTVLREKIAPGAFKEPLARPRGVLRFRHKGEHQGETDDLDNFYGVMTGMAEKDGAVYADFEVFPGEREDKLLKLVSSGAITGASMAAVVKGDRKVRDAAGPLTEITRISEVNGASITPARAYDDAEVVAFREQRTVDPEQARKTLAARDAARKDWETARKRIDRLLASG
jgi:phage head maturation protease